MNTGRILKVDAALSDINTPSSYGIISSSDMVDGLNGRINAIKPNQSPGLVDVKVSNFFIQTSSDNIDSAHVPTIPLPMSSTDI